MQMLARLFSCLYTCVRLQKVYKFPTWVYPSLVRIEFLLCETKLIATVEKNRSVWTLAELAMVPKNVAVCQRHLLESIPFVVGCYEKSCFSLAFCFETLLWESTISSCFTTVWTRRTLTCCHSVPGRYLLKTAFHVCLNNLPVCWKNVQDYDTQWVTSTGHSCTSA